MAIVNIIDKRSNENTRFCDIIFEIFYHANEYSFKNGSPPIFPLTQKKLKGYEHWTEWMDNISIYSAIIKAIDIKAHVTLVLYDLETIQGNITPLSIIHPMMNDKRMDSPYWLR